MSVPANSHIAMTVNNDCVSDGRVIKTAETLAATGARVSVVCPASERAPGDTTRNGVDYVRFGKVAGDVPSAVPFRPPVPPSMTRQAVRTALGLAKRALRHSWAADTRRIQIITGRAFKSSARLVLRDLSPDIIHAHDLATLSCAVEVGNDLGVPVIYDAHELEIARNSVYSQRVWNAIERTEKRLIKQCAGVVTVSFGIAEFLADRYNIKQPTVIYNAPRAGKPCAETLRDRCWIGDDTTLAVYVGLISINRGLEDCVKALRCGDFHLALIGPRNEDVINKLRIIADKDGTSGRLNIIDPVEPEQVVSFISTANVSLALIPGACLSYEYCMPNKLFESVAAGVPVIASNRRDMADYVRDYDCGMVLETVTPQTIARAIEHQKENSFEFDAPATWDVQEPILTKLYERTLAS